ncbi:MAG: glutathione peroxidase [Acidobacteriaceae bacterium]|nr:glutathione peroxidase [Acidobacteriaceae bacterium]MBV9778703.1 glutathione peroxidase [Acidobacteriaceae bacterium]
MLKSVLVLAAVLAGSARLSPASSIYDYKLMSIDMEPVPLSQLKGKVVMLVNVASRCGYTPQYAGLEALYRKYKDQGFVIVGIPANNFGQQEPGTNSEIKVFCKRKYDVTFPMMAKVSVAGNDIAPLYEYLTDKTANPSTGGEIKWNFTKFLISRDGKILARFEPDVTPEDPALVGAVEGALK